MNKIHLIRAQRRHFALSQGELGELLALSQGEISRLEENRRSVNLETALALQVIFDIEPRVVFADRYAAAEDRVMRRAARLDDKLRGRTDRGSQRKLELLRAMARRAKHSL